MIARIGNKKDPLVKSIDKGVFFGGATFENI